VAQATKSIISGSSHTTNPHNDLIIIIIKWLEPQRRNYYYKVARATTKELLL